MVFWLLPMVYRPPYWWYIEHPTHGILTPYQWYIYIDPPIHGILNPYPWYVDPHIHGIFTPLPMICWPPAYLLIRNEGGQLTIQGDQNSIWHWSVLHSWTITGFVIRLKRRVPLVEQEQLTFLEHPGSVPVFSGVCVTRSLVLCVCFVDHCLSFCHCVVRPSIYGFLFPFRLWYLETLFKKSCYSFPNRLLC